jgi:hypothetical protein
VLGRCSAENKQQAQTLATLLTKKATPPKNATEMDEIRVIANWFHANPQEKKRTQKVSAFLATK